MDTGSMVIAFLVAIASSAYGASVAGPGLILIPTLLLLGVPPKIALSTAIFGYMGMTLVGGIVYGRAGKINWKDILPFTALATLGALIGPWILGTTDSDVLRQIIGIIMLALVLFSIVKKGNLYTQQHSAVNRQRQILGLALAFPLGIYSSSIALGASIFLTYIMLYCFGQSLLESAASRKIIFAGSNGIAIIGFALQGFIDWPLGIVLFVGNMIGTYIGARFALEKEGAWLRYLFIVVVVISGLQLLLG